jgi:sulfite dehydrogenase
VLDRRHLIKGAGVGALALGSGTALGSFGALALDTVTMPFENGERPLVKYPQKRPMIGLTSRPPQLETPFSVFDEGAITPNDAFFVRYHLAGIPLNIDPDTFAIEIKGKVDKPAKISLQELKQFDAIETVAVNQCSGNSRGFVTPRVAGGQLGNGAMGNARWKGVPLKAVLDKAGVQRGARQVTFNGMDEPISDKTPGYYGTYWVKHLNEITVVDDVFDGFWMKSAYRIPDNACACVPPGTAPKATVPINRLGVRSFITNVTDGAKLKAGGDTLLKGIAFDGGYGITEVAVSTDGGKIWTEAALGEDLGKCSFREWRLPVKLAAGMHELKVRAVNRIGQSQPTEALWNPPGYMRNVVETVRVSAA